MRYNIEKTTLLFDIDGTLLRVVNSLHFQSFQRAVQNHFGVDANRGNLRIAGMFDRQIIVEMLAAKGVEVDYLDPRLEPLFREIGSDYVKQSRKKQNNAVLMPGARNLLIRIKEIGLVAGLVTGNVEAVAWEKMRLSGLADMIMPFGGFGDAPVRTRGGLIPIALENAVALTGRRPALHQTVMVGDTPRDVEAAREAGVKVVAVCGTYSRRELEDHSPDLLLDSLEQVDEFFGFIEGLSS